MPRENQIKQLPEDHRNLDFEAGCVDMFAEIVSVLGIPRSIGQIYGVLFASPQPLRFSDIVERLQISKGSVSQGLQVLRELGAIRDATGAEPSSDEISDRQPGATVRLIPSRLAPKISPVTGEAIRNGRVAYVPELSLRKLVSGVLRERIAPMAATSAEQLARLQESASQRSGAGGFYLDRAKQLNSWRRRLKTVLPVLTALLGPIGTRSSIDAAS